MLYADATPLRNVGEDGAENASGLGAAGRKRRRLDTNLTLPSDATILVNLFCAYLDTQLPRSNRMDRPFTRRFLLEGASTWEAHDCLEVSLTV
eukprot:scaffold434_cov186-Pinguiococcus_pyrenoidosus.AAC.85